MHGCTSWQEIHNGLFMRVGFPSVAHYVQPCLLCIVSAESDGTASVPPPPCSLDLYSALHVFGRSSKRATAFLAASSAQPRRDLRDGVNVAPKEALFKVAKLNEINMLSGASGSIAEVAPSHRRYNSIIINNLQDWWPGRHRNTFTSALIGFGFSRLGNLSCPQNVTGKNARENIVDVRPSMTDYAQPIGCAFYRQTASFPSP